MSDRGGARSRAGGVEPGPVDLNALASLADYERAAAAVIDSGVWGHIAHGSQAANSAAFDKWGLLPRPLADLTGGSTATRLFGLTHAAPLLLAPVAYHALVHPQAELASVRAATALDTTLAISTLSSLPLEDIAAAARDAAAELGKAAPPPLWFQLYLQRDFDRSLALVRRAEQAGYQVLVVTVDAAIKHSGFALPDGVRAANLADEPPAPLHSAAAGAAGVFASPLVAQAPTWETITRLRAHTALPLVIKGLLHPDDARRARDLGADGVVVSNHAGRVVDGVVPALTQLPAVRAALGADYPVLFDSGIRRGSDVLKALALGADAAMVGLPQLHGLAVGGLAGVAHVLHILRTEFELAMAQCGCADVASIERDLVVPV